MQTSIRRVGNDTVVGGLVVAAFISHNNILGKAESPRHAVLVAYFRSPCK